jgi:hypothetical protein
MRSRTVALLLLVLASGRAFPEAGEKKALESFNWFQLMGQGSVAAFDALRATADLYAAGSYDRKELLRLLLDLYAEGRKLEKAHPYDKTADAETRRYKLDDKRKYGGYLPMDWALLLSFNVRTAMQYILLEILSTQNLPAATGRIPVVWALYDEYFHYYATLKDLQ